MAFEHCESFETGDASQYVLGTLTSMTSGGQGRGGTAAGQQNGNNMCIKSVTPESTKFQGASFKSVVNPSSTTWGLFAFGENSSMTSSNRHVSIQMTANTIKAYRGTTSGTLLGTSAALGLLPNTHYHYECKVVVHDTTGSIEVRVDGVAVLTLSGIDTRNGNTGVIDCVGLGSLENDSGGGNFAFFDDWNTQDAAGSFQGDIRVGYSAANASGSNSSATASSSTILSCVDETASNGDTDYDIQDNTSLPKSVSFNVADAPSNTIAILAVKPLAQVRKDDAGTNAGRLLLISGGTTSDGGSDLSVPASYQQKNRIHETDPNTSAAWTITNFNAIEVGWKRTA